jgi:flagellar biosynthesis/type III secretory pathway protein FliH
MELQRVLKAGQQAERWPRRRLSAAEWMGAERAQALIASAEVEAAAVRRAALEDRAAALVSGRQEGLGAARELVEHRLAELASYQQRWLARAEVEALDLAVEMARRLVGRELQGDPARVGEGMMAAVRAAGRRQVLRIRLHPECVAQIRQRATADGTTGVSDLDLVADPSLVPGDVVVETEAGRVDARISRRLDGFRAAIERGAA